MIQEANAVGLKSLALEASVEMGAALINNKDYSHARPELDRALDTSEKFGMRLETAKIHFLLGNLLRLTGNSSEATGHYQQTVRMLDEMKKESGAEHVLERSDLRAMYTEASSWSHST